METKPCPNLECAPLFKVGTSVACKFNCGDHILVHRSTPGGMSGMQTLHTAMYLLLNAGRWFERLNVEPQL
jgi:hypothetical protein